MGIKVQFRVPSTQDKKQRRGERIHRVKEEQRQATRDSLAQIPFACVAYNHNIEKREPIFGKQGSSAVII